MPFEIEPHAQRPNYAINARDTMMDGVLDSLPADASQERIDAALALAIMGKLRQPKLQKTVRHHLLQNWHFIAPMAERDPALFDSILVEFADCITSTR